MVPREPKTNLGFMFLCLARVRKSLKLLTFVLACFRESSFRIVVAALSVLSKDEREIAQAKAPYLRKVNWRSDLSLRGLYALGFIICIALATIGYDR